MRNVLVFTFVLTTLMQAQGFTLEAALEKSGANRRELERALAAVSGDRKSSMEWMIARMPESDLRVLDADYLIENVHEAHQGFEAAPWRTSISRAVFLDAVLPYANVSEKRERWRKDFRSKFSPMIANAKTPGEAAVILNQRVFAELKIKYSTKRSRADQGPLESQTLGLASCTGLTVVLVDACRAVGVPARFAGTPLWADGSGNHSWAEIWDGTWKFTGAAEPTGDRLNEGWFADRAANALTGDPRRGIFAVTWNASPLTFPMVWAPHDHSMRAIDVSERYKKADITPAGFARVRFRVRREETRTAVQFEVVNTQGTVLHRGETRDERFDANDHVTLMLPLGARLTFATLGTNASPLTDFVVTSDGQLVDVKLEVIAESGPASRAAATSRQIPPGSVVVSPVDELKNFLIDGGTLEAAASRPFSTRALTKSESTQAAALVVKAHQESLREQRKQEMADRVIEVDGAKMRFWYAVYGDRPPTGRSLWISLHGGGGAPSRVNDQQWENQKKLYKPAEGVYVAPRAPTDTWNLWHQPPIDRLFDRLIENMMAFEGVDPNRVFVMGYSAGGDGVFQLAPRLADRWAAAAMMAGHPGDASALSLRNLPFTIQMGGKDSAYDRNKHAREWKVLLDELHKADPEGYPNWVEVHETKGHWMDRADGAAVPWMAKFTRNLRPNRVVWKQDDVTTSSSYWLRSVRPMAHSLVVATRSEQVVRIVDLKDFQGELEIALDDSMVDLDRDVKVVMGEREIFSGRVSRTVQNLISTLTARGDSCGMFAAKVRITP